MSEISIDDSPIKLAGVGPFLLGKLNDFGINKIIDLLFLFPIRYEDRTRIANIDSLVPGEKKLIEVEIDEVKIIFRGRRVMVCRVYDDSAMINLKFFHFSNSQFNNLKAAKRVRCFGEARQNKQIIEMIHPEYKIINSSSENLNTNLTAVYPSAGGLHQARIRSLIEQSLKILEKSYSKIDFLSPIIGGAYPSLTDSLRFLHSPPANSDIKLLEQRRHPSQIRISLEEMLAQRLALLRLSNKNKEDLSEKIVKKDDSVDQFINSLPFELTNAQSSVINEIFTDLKKNIPMHRLLQGDVGSGKTVVAASAALRCHSNSLQAVFMAPTELLAEQHYINFKEWFNFLDIDIAFLSGSTPEKERSTILEKIKSGKSSIIIGTHALFQRAVEFNKVGLIIIDEQHRFGVDQRLKLKLKGRDFSPHQLVITATPIPRTLAMIAYADLDSSIINELPKGRQLVETNVMPEAKRDILVKRVLAHCKKGQQAYWVCPLIEESEVIDSQAAKNLIHELSIVMPTIEIGLLHGKMKYDEKEKVMRAFKNKKIDLLVSTTVIEVGVDVPNATLMVIENSERMGLSQLHQLRGRVGRGDFKSNCILLYKPPLNELSRQRLGAIRETNDGFIVAKKDLELRGPGEILGKRQAGLCKLKIADFSRDSFLLSEVIELSDKIISERPDLINSLIERWFGDTANYAKV
ncbi:MAG: hypothetical protein CBC38_02430 [Gammaproteobacteria bacterium TMED78]|nr:MAG: hypothetical protein CBC38_02430 [Gammaproteobacteria bacterium TMED78]|tara:strand:+ start:144286 stop:146355 length:2070 start_codon:yes stop_codon:yes gene_type:complete